MPKFGKIACPGLYPSNVEITHAAFSPLKCQEGLLV